MKEKIKKFFLPSFNKKIFLVSFGLVVIGFLFSPHLALAIAFWDYIVGALTFIPYAAINILAQLAIVITGALVTLAGMILDWVLSDSFCSLSYTNAGLNASSTGWNPVIDVGFNITRSFVNMALVLILIFIAFSTILRISGYETKKLLVNLIIVALLVNFAPVICGLVVDASNIAMHYFTEHITGLSNLVNLVKTTVKRVLPGWEILKFTQQMGQYTESAVLFIFNLLLIFILLMFAFLFVIRYIAIWILVILSPLAFVCYILPATRKIWNLWWNQLIQWSILGIVAGFFLYLGEQVSVKLPDAIKLSSDLTALATTTESGVFDKVLPHFVTLAFLFIGLVMALTTSATGAKQITLAVKRGGKAAGKVALPKGWEWTKKGAKGAKETWKETWEKTGGAMKRRYERARIAGISRTGAFKEAAKVIVPPPKAAYRLWRRRVKAAPKTAWAATKAATKGIGEAIKDTGEAFGRAAFGIKKKQKGLIKCPECGANIPASAQYCPYCNTEI